MKLYFENSYGERRLIAQPQEQTEVGLENVDLLINVMKASRKIRNFIVTIAALGQMKKGL